jgi:hypothetical protein
VKAFAISAWLLFFSAVAAAQAPALRLPLECTPGNDCWISNHVDLDDGPGARDYACGGFTYNGHSGTDIALRDLAAMQAGVTVVAAADGVVRGTRDGVEDVNVRRRVPEAVAGTECGNGVRVDHGGGWQTQYCHLRRGSVAVKRGERVRAGQALGLVGLSGLTEYPHLHFSVRRGAAVIDPFRGEGAAPECGAGERPLWDAATLGALGYAPGTIYNFGVAPRVPKAPEVRAGALRERSLPSDAPAIVVWAEVFRVSGGDTLRVSVQAPDGPVLFQHQESLKTPQARVFRAFGRKRGAGLWAPGTYWVTIATEKIAVAGRPPTTIRFSFEIR